MADLDRAGRDMPRGRCAENIDIDTGSLQGGET